MFLLELYVRRGVFMV